MSLITIPSVSAKGFEMFYVRGDQALGMFGGPEVILQSSPGETKWGVSFSLELLDATDATIRSWIGALVQLAKLDNSFNLTPPGQLSNGASYAGTNPAVNGGSQLGTSLICDGVSVTTAIGVIGDPIEIEGINTYHHLIEDATSDGSGNVTLNFEPAMRSSPADPSNVNVKTPQLTLRLLDPKIGWQISIPSIRDIIIKAIEAYPAT